MFVLIEEQVSGATRTSMRSLRKDSTPKLGIILVDSGGPEANRGLAYVALARYDAGPSVSRVAGKGPKQFDLSPRCRQNLLELHAWSIIEVARDNEYQ